MHKPWFVERAEAYDRVLDDLRRARAQLDVTIQLLEQGKAGFGQTYPVTGTAQPPTTRGVMVLPEAKLTGQIPGQEYPR